MTWDAADGEIIDCHYHPEVDAATHNAWYEPLRSVEEQIATLRRAGIARACGAPVRRLQPDSFAPIRALNDMALALRDRFPEFCLPGIHVHPRFPQESCAELDRCCGGEGVRWVGELVGYMMGYGEEFASPDALTVLGHAGRRGAVVNFHCNDLEVIERLCRALPGTTLVLAHPGGSAPEQFRARLALVARYPNLHMDISGSGVDRYGILRRGIDAAGADKFLFGTDYPFNNPAVYVQGVRFERLTDEERAAIFSRNFRRLVRLKSGATEQT